MFLSIVNIAKAIPTETTIDMNTGIHPCFVIENTRYLLSKHSQ